MSRIRNSKVPHTPEGHRGKALAAIESLASMLPVGEILQGHQLITIANLLHMAYSVGRLDGMRDMVDDTVRG